MTTVADGEPDHAYGVLYTISDSSSPDCVRYVGKTTIGIHARATAHWNASKRGSLPISRFLRKRIHDRNLVDFRVVRECCNAEELNLGEIDLISRLRTSGQADLNITDGGDGASGFKRPESWRRMMSSRFSGDKSPGAKLNWAAVREMRQVRMREYVPLREMARRYGVSDRCIRWILSGKTWKDPGYSPASLIPAPPSRTPLGLPVGTKVLSDEQVREIRHARVVAYVSPTDLGRRYGVSSTTITRILANESRRDAGFDPSLVVPRPTL